MNPWPIGLSSLIGPTGLACACLATGGCLKRTINISTNPPGALVHLNDVEVGRTPLQTDFTFYGVYGVRVNKEGYEPIVTTMKAPLPAKEYPLVDLGAEALPVRLETNFHWHFDLVPVAEATDPEGATRAAVERARAFREAQSRPATAPPSQHQE